MVHDARASGTSTSSAPDRWSACYAPHTAMYFDQHGKVRACCQNAGVYLGDATRQSLREIWEGAEAEQMRTALERGDYSSGCDFCEWQLREGNDEIVFARQYDQLRPAARRPRWPKLMEFALTNTCNLQCVMCNGNWSSTIRAKREGRPPLQPAYGERFYEEVAPFLPHLEEARFLGGEPFLGHEPLRVMEMLAELPAPPTVTITTNGTLFTDRVRHLIRSLRPNIVVSLDGATAAVFDRIRVGAHLPQVLANLDRFCADLGAGKVTITHCLMVDNWHEFPDLLLLAERRGLHVGVNVVRFPPERSLYHLPAVDLAEVVAGLLRAEPELTGARRAAWENHVGALSHRLALLQEGEQDRGLATAFLLQEDDPAPAPSPVDLPAPLLSRWQWLPFPEQGPATANGDPAPIAGPCLVATIGTDGTVGVERADADAPIDGAGLDGAPFEDLVERMSSAYGSITSWVGQPRRRGRDDDLFAVLLSRPDEEPATWWVARALRASDGRLVGGRHVVGHVDPAALRAGSW